MTIPSLGGSGKDFSGKININQPSQIVPQPVDIERPMADTNIPVQASAPAPAKVIEPEQKPVAGEPVAVKPEPKAKKEYSIEQFAKDYEEILVNRILPELSQYEGERKKRLTGAVICAVVLGLLAIYIFFNVEGRSAGDAAGLCIGGAILAWSALKKSFENKLKKKVMPILMRAIPGFYWQQTPPVTSKHIDDCRIISCSDRCGKSFDDCFIGDYRKVPVAISECKYEIGSGKNRRTVFQGVVIRIKMNKNFEGTTLIRAKNAYNADKSDLKKAGSSQVKLEDPEFEKLYTVYGTDQIEARYLITTAFMERLKCIRLAFKAKHISCSFYGDSVYIAPHTGTDLFSLCSLVKPVNDRKQFEILFNEFASILQLVDHFKLDKRLGL